MAPPSWHKRPAAFEFVRGAVTYRFTAASVSLAVVRGSVAIALMFVEIVPEPAESQQALGAAIDPVRYVKRTIPDGCPMPPEAIIRKGCDAHYAPCESPRLRHNSTPVTLSAARFKKNT